MMCVLGNPCLAYPNAKQQEKHSLKIIIVGHEFVWFPVECVMLCPFPISIFMTDLRKETQ